MRLLFVLSVAVLVAVVATPALGVDGFTSDPGNLTLTAVPAAGVEGDSIKIEGEGWPTLSEVAIQTCGNLGLRGSSDCDVQNTTLTVTNKQGQLATFHTVTSPPVDCPCSIKVEAIGQIEQGYVAYELQGYPVSELVRPPDQALQSLDVEARLVGTGPWTAWLGLSPRRTLELTLTNLSNAPVSNAPIVVRTGRGADAMEIVDTSAYPIPDIPPGRATVVEIPVDLSAPAWGAYSVQGEVGVYPRQADFSAETKEWPIFGIVLLIALLQFPIFKGRNWARARLADLSEASALSASSPEAFAEQEPELLPAPVQVPASAPDIEVVPAVAVAAVVSDESEVVPMPIPIAIGVGESWSAQIPVEFQPVPAGQTPIVTVSFEKSAAGDSAAPRIIGITIGGDIELRLRSLDEAEALHAGPDLEAELA
ncbi:MAG: hypothetical protein ACR2N2_01700 [Acidimicrobiia bacterium]